MDLLHLVSTRLVLPLALATAVVAQDPTEDPTTTTGRDRTTASGRQLTPDQIAEQLEQVKSSILPKVMSDKVAGSEPARKKWLAEWRAIPSPHYLVFSNGPVTCKKYAETLERLYAYVKKELPFQDVDHLLTAFIFADSEEYYRFAIQITGYSEQSARATAGHATAAYYATYYESPTAPAVFHEATHQIVSACLKVPGVGSWFQEGVAVYFEKKTSGDKLGGAMKSDVKRGDYYPLTEFFDIPVLLSDKKGNGHRNYEHAGALIDFMINTKVEPVAGRFGEFLAAARRGRGFGRGKDVSSELIKVVYGLTVPEFELAWKKHLGLAK
jgi:hypothetical protein